MTIEIWSGSVFKTWFSVSPGTVTEIEKTLVHPTQATLNFESLVTLTVDRCLVAAYAE